MISESLCPPALRATLHPHATPRSSNSPNTSYPGGGGGFVGDKQRFIMSLLVGGI
ncbi:hypothetical protein L218DRAFT_959610 [Marasmius fiardii PR-910]|nr:hypothetical protein L218DRAFT_959610 [Marasmius fiardii PR-910]